MSKVENAVMRCIVVGTFSVHDIRGDKVGVILNDVIDGSNALYLSYASDLEQCDNICATQGIEIPLRAAPGRASPFKFTIPLYLVEIGKGPIVRCASDMRRIYLAHLYNRPLYESGRGDGKNYDPAAVFADPVLKLIWAAYKYLSGCDMHEALRENDYQYERLGVYTRFHDDNENIIYNTPRTMNYYPEIRTIRASWSIGGTPMDVVRHNDPMGETATQVKSQPYRLQIQRVYQNEGWKSLRREMESDKKLHAFVKQFYENGYGVSGSRTLAESVA